MQIVQVPTGPSCLPIQVVPIQVEDQRFGYPAMPPGSSFTNLISVMAVRVTSGGFRSLVLPPAGRGAFFGSAIASS